jgi:hypothetical protein
MAQVQVREFTSPDGSISVRWAGPFDVVQGDRTPKHVVMVTAPDANGRPARRAFHFQHPINAEDAWDHWTGGAPR